MLDTTKIDPKVKEAIAKNLGIKPGSIDEIIRNVTPEQAFVCYCNWHGLIGWGPDLVRALDNLRAAVVDDAVSRLVELKAAANEACKAASANKADIKSRAVNWRNLYCSEAQMITNDSGSQSYRVIIEEASPDVFGLQRWIAERLKDTGWPDVEVDTEW